LRRKKSETRKKKRVEFGGSSKLKRPLGESAKKGGGTGNFLWGDDADFGEKRFARITRKSDKRGPN